MRGTVRISRRAAFSLLEYMHDTGRSLLWPEIARELERALERKPRRKPDARKVAKRATAKEKRAALRERIAVRAYGRCETHACGTPAHLEMDHFWGRARAESFTSCWLICAYCHRLKTANSPSAAYWLVLFRDHCERNGYRADAAKAQSRLDALALVEEAQEVTRGAK